MFYILLALALFVISVITHIVYCRKTSKPGLHAKAFVMTAFTFGVMDFVIVAKFWKMFDPHSLWGLQLGFTAGIIFILLIPVYLCFYVLTQLTSPSKKILSIIHDKKEVSYVDILAGIEEEDFIKMRMSDLCISGCVVQENDRYMLTAQGRKIAVLLNVMQGLLGRQAGG